jgi:membrane-associated phospholipid phosphatase
MTMQPTLSRSLPRLGWLPWRTALAQGVSQLGSPPLLSIAGACLCARASADPGALDWALGYSLLAFVAPTLYIVWLFCRGKVDDLHLNNRRQRLRPLCASLAAAGMALVLLLVGEAPGILVAMGVGNLVQGALFLAITCRWKISAHCTAAGGLAVLGLGRLDSAGLLLVLCLPLVAWARLYLRRHTLAQVAAGTLLGAGLWAIALLS